MPPLSSPAVCTIIAKNYLGSARVLMDSLAAREPSAARYVLIVDEWKDLVDAREENFTIVSLGELGLPDLPRHCFKYDLVELATAVKPRLLQLLLQKHSKVLYFDPDMVVLHSLGELFSRLDAHAALITPHTTQAYPEDGLWPDNKTLLLHGVFNLGFIGVRASEGTDAFLSWWRDYLDLHSTKEVGSGFYVDQKIMDLAPGIFPIFHILSEPAYNTAFWNIHYRRLLWDGTRWLCNGAPLVFFHFSGFSPTEPGVLSKSEGKDKRYDLRERPDLAALLKEYAEKLISRRFLECRKWPYTYHAFATGKPITYEIRAYLRDHPEGLAPGDNPFKSSRLERLAAFLKISHKIRARLYYKWLEIEKWIAGNCFRD